MWFKHDLRTDDHPGLADPAAAAAPVVACYCFDERLCGHLLRTPRGFEGVRAGVSTYLVVFCMLAPLIDCIPRLSSVTVQASHCDTTQRLTDEKALPVEQELRRSLHYAKLRR